MHRIDWNLHNTYQPNYLRYNTSKVGDAVEDLAIDTSGVDWWQWLSVTNTKDGSRPDHTLACLLWLTSCERVRNERIEKWLRGDGKRAPVGLHEVSVVWRSRMTWRVTPATVPQTPNTIFMSWKWEACDKRRVFLNPLVRIAPNNLPNRTAFSAAELCKNLLHTTSTPWEWLAY